MTLSVHNRLKCHERFKPDSSERGAQILAYCIATGVKHGMLIYPLDAVATDDTVQVRKTHIAIEQKTINLGLPFKQFQQECGHFAGEVLSLATLSALEVSA